MKAKKSTNKATKQTSKISARTKTITILLIVMSVFLLLTSACERAPAPPSEVDSETIQSIGSGSTTFQFNMVDGDGEIHAWNVSTNESTVGAALLGVGLIEGTTSDFGLMVSHVNGIRADFMEDDAWWAFYIGDEMAMAGVDATEIENGVVYAFVYTPA